MDPRWKGINEVIEFVLPRLTDRADLSSASQVCSAWYEADRETREHVTVPLCYAAKPRGLSGRFPNLKSIEIKGRPRLDMPLASEESSGSFAATPWINEIAISKLSVVNSIRFKRMVITDLDLDVLSMALENRLKTFQLKCCSGFSSDGLLSVTKRCRKIQSLILSWSTLVEDKNGDWLHQVALHNTHLRVLHCYQTNISKVSIEDLETIAKTCSSSLVSLKISGFDLLRLQSTLRLASVLEEFYGGAIVVDDDPRKYRNTYFSPKLCRVGALVGLFSQQIPILYGFSDRLKTLDLFGTVLSCFDHSLILRRVPNLEILKTSTCIGNIGLLVLSEYCKKLKELEICEASDRVDQERYPVTDRGLIPVAKSCIVLERVKLCVMQIGNETLRAIAHNLKDLRSFHLKIIWPRHTSESDMPLDCGVKVLLRRCDKLRHITLDLFRDFVTDSGLRHIAEFGSRLRKLKLCWIGDSDRALDDLARGCQELQSLQLIFSSFSDSGIASAVNKLPKLQNLFVRGYKKVETCHPMNRPEWTISVCPSTMTPYMAWHGMVR